MPDPQFEWTVFSIKLFPYFQSSSRRTTSTGYLSFSDPARAEARSKKVCRIWFVQYDSDNMFPKDLPCTNKVQTIWVNPLRVCASLSRSADCGSSSSRLMRLVTLKC